MKFLRWIKDRLKHKLEHVRPSHLSKILKEHGIALIIIIITWEIIEDIMFPVLFLWLGKNVNPWFTAGAPISWLLCLHPIMVPASWLLWIRAKNYFEKKIT